MSAVFGSLSVVGFFVGIALMILGAIKKRKYRGWIISLVSIVVFVVAIATSSDSGDDKATAASSKSDQTDNYKTTPGKISNARLLVNLAYTGQKLVEQYDKLDGVRVNSNDIDAQKLFDSQDDDTGDIYKNTYSVRGFYHWQGRRYNFSYILAFSKNNVNSKGIVAGYDSDMSGNLISTKRTTLDAKTEAKLDKNTKQTKQKATIESLQDFSSFTANYKKLGADKTPMWDKYLYKTQVKWSGTVMELGNRQIYVWGAKGYNGQTWSDVAGEGKTGAYNVFVAKFKGDTPGSIKVGDKITVRGSLESRGDYTLNYEWKLYNATLD